MKGLLFWYLVVGALFTAWALWVVPGVRRYVSPSHLSVALGLLVVFWPFYVAYAVRCAYQAWCERRGRLPKDPRDFGR